MKERIISNKELKKLKHFNPCAHSESVLYIDKDEVLKLLDQYSQMIEKKL